MELIIAAALDSPARTRPPERRPLRVAAVQVRWHEDSDEHEAAIAAGVSLAAGAGAELVCLPELTLSRYFAVDPAGVRAAGAVPEPLPGGPTFELAARLARQHGVYVHASLFERAQLPGELGYNTAILIAPDGTLAGRTRKLHIPITAGYHESSYFHPGPADEEAVRTFPVGDARVGLPTCWDQWFPELARAYCLVGADLLIYPTAIGSEPDHPGFDTQPLWRQVMIGHAIANGLFIVAINRYGDEGALTFYGSSFIADPYGRVLAAAPRERGAVLVADLDLDQRRDWLELFPFPETRRPDAYAALTEPRH